MSKPATSSRDNTLVIVDRLNEMTKLDTLFKDLYLQRARTLLSGIFSNGSYIQYKENSAQLPYVKQQLRVSVERSDWKRSSDLTERLRQLQTRVAAGSQFAKLAESIYERAADVTIDQFSTGMNVFAGVTTESLLGRRAEAINILQTLERTDPEKKEFYARRAADFKRLSIVTSDMVAEDKDARADASQLQQAALSALDSGDLSKLDQMIANFATKGETKETKKEQVDTEPLQAAGVGDDLIYNFTEQTLAVARELGLRPVRTQSRRHFAYLIPHGWQPSFRKDEVKQWSKEKLSRMTYPENTTDGAREAIDFFLLNPFVNSGGTRYRVCLAAEDLLLEDFPEPDPKGEVESELLDRLKLNRRWGLSRVEIENALLEHGSEVLRELQLDNEAFRLIAIPADIYTHLGAQQGWGQKEMWTHYDGYRVLEGGKLQALGGGDKRFGGTHDVVSFSADYASTKLFARFAVVQRKRMMDWQH